MKFDRTKNALRNIIFGLLQRIYQLIVPFAMRTAMIYWLGVEYFGIRWTFHIGSFCTKLSRAWSRQCYGLFHVQAGSRR